MRRPRIFMLYPKLLSPFPPDADAHDHNDERQGKLAGCAYPAELASGHGDAAILRRLRTNRDQVLVGGEPVDGVRGQIVVAIEIDEAIRCPVGIAENDESSLRILIAGVVRTSGSERQRSFLVFRIVYVDGGRA